MRRRHRMSGASVANVEVGKIQVGARERLRWYSRRDGRGSMGCDVFFCKVYLWARVGVESEAVRDKGVVGAWLGALRE